MGDRDPLHRRILERLGGDLNPQDFEAAVCDLLRDVFPSLVPIRGGRDAGRDGAIVDGEGEAFPLVCTTGADVIRNLTASLDSYLRNGGRRRKVVLATSQVLTPKRRSSLERRAVEKGFTLVQVIDRYGIADRLYRDAGWRKKLLALSGSPEALSAVPLSKRPFLELTPVGREEDLHWLLTTTGDRVLSGQPGSGKTFLLQHLIRRGWPGLFLVSRDETEIANALCAQPPGFTVIVDDAHADLDALVRLRRLREETDTGFDILATTWEGNRDSVLESLGLPAATRELALLTRNEILMVYRQAGITEDNTDRDLLRELVDQASNRPGLAATLAVLWLRGGWREVLSGKALSRHVRETFRSLVGADADALLAAFALGGDQGMSLTAVGEFLQIGRAEVWRQTAALAVGGALSAIEREVLAVRPHQLRSALIWAVFFPDPGRGAPHPYGPLLDRAPSLGSAVAALIQAKIYGMPIPDAELRELVLRADALDPWRKMAEKDRELRGLLRHADVFAAWQGLTVSSEGNARWALQHYPGDVLQIAREALLRAPRQIIPILLARAPGFGGASHSHPDHPFRLLERWIREPLEVPAESIQRRQLLAREIARYLRDGGDPAVGLEALSLALSPRLEASSRDPGLGDRVWHAWGVLPEPMLQALGDVWTAVRGELRALPLAGWPSLAAALGEWIDPEYVAPGVSAEARRTLRDLAAGVIADLAPLALSSPGLSAELRKLGARLGLAIDLPGDPIFETLFPEPDFEAIAELDPPDLRDVVAAWSRDEPSSVARRLARYEAEARQLDRRWRRYTPRVCRELASQVSSPEEWLEAWSTERLDGDLAEPFLQELLRRRPEGWETTLEAWLSAEPWRETVASVLAGDGDLPAPLEERTLTVLRARPGLTYLLVLRQVVSLPRIHALLQSPDWEAALAAAAGLWSSHPRKSIPPGLRDDWRRAVLRADSEVENRRVQYSLAEILAEDRALAFEWLRARIQAGHVPRHLSLDSAARGPFRTALAGLEVEQRGALLNGLVPRAGLSELLPLLVNRDVALYEQLLERVDLRDFHLAPLQGLPDPQWIPLALAAAAAGWEARDIAAAAVYGPAPQIWWGSEVQHWTGWHSSFAALEDDPHEEIRAIGRAGQALIESRIQKARTEERNNALGGLA